MNVQLMKIIFSTYFEIHFYPNSFNVYLILIGNFNVLHKSNARFEKYFSRLSNTRWFSPIILCNIQRFLYTSSKFKKSSDRISRKNTIVVLLGRRKFLCFVNSNRVLGIGENPNSHYTNKCAMPPPHAVYESIFLRLFFQRSYLSHISCSRRVGCKQRLLPIYYMMIFLRQKTLAFIILYTYI